MTKFLTRTLILAIVSALAFSCSGEKVSVYDYDNILDISYTPNQVSRAGGWFSDSGSWYGFTVPEKENWVNGFCGPFALDLYVRRWVSDAAVKVCFADEDTSVVYTPSASHYYPGELRIEASSSEGEIVQSLVYLDDCNVLLQIRAGRKPLKCFGTFRLPGTAVTADGNVLKIAHPRIGKMSVNFPKSFRLTVSDSSYTAVSGASENVDVILSFNKEASDSSYPVFVGNASEMRKKTALRWNGYLKKIVRKDMRPDYSRIAVKAVVTLIANWKAAKGDLIHEGVVPSQGVGYFMGFWGWDSWKHAAALSRFAPEVAENQVRAMFDYQTPEGMIVDCIFTNSKGNNNRDSKPPLAVWAVSEIYARTGDAAFVKEMLPKLLKYHQWWYKYRDHDANGICEYGSCDGTLIAAAWESGMDNAVRFDSTEMVANAVLPSLSETSKMSEASGVPSKDADTVAWSMNQESVDLNAFLAYERSLLEKLASAVGESLSPDLPSAASKLCTGEDYRRKIADYFYVETPGFFFDRRLDGKSITAEGTEACIPLWTGIASKEQAEAAHKIFTDTSKFDIYIPFPTVSADNPKFDTEGYWRGSTWLDQVYFGIEGLRRYGYGKDADRFTREVFDRLDGLTGAGPICENYNPRTGAVLEAPNFSWSAAHLLLLYESYGK